MGRRVLPLLMAALLIAQAAAAGPRELWPDPPDETIRKAGKGQEVVWRLPVGSALPEDLRFLSPGRILVSLRQEDQGLDNLPILLVDSGTGEVLWSYDRSRRDGVFRPVLLTEQTLAWLVEGKKRDSILALDGSTGAERWAMDLPGRGAVAMPSYDGASILVMAPGKKDVSLTLKDARTGADRWSVSFPLADPTGEVIAPVFLPEGLWHFFGGVTRMDPGTGKTLWSRPDLLHGRSDPPLEAAGKRLFLAAGPKLLCLDASAGRTVWEAPLGSLRPSNIYAQGERVYVRGTGDGPSPHHLAAFALSDGRLLWTHQGTEPVLSNLLPYPGRLVAATGTSVVALSDSTGQELFRTAVTSTGGTFPVRLRPYADRVVFLGELTVAAVEVASGRRLWSKGMSPVSSEASLSSLDGSIPRLNEELGYLGKNPVDYGASLAGQLLVQYQQDTARYNRQYESARSRGDYWDAEKASLQARVSSSFERMQATISFCLSAMEAAEWIRRAMEGAQMEGLLRRHELLLRSIVGGYGDAEGPGWALRPNRRYRSMTDDFVGVDLVTLPDGQGRFVPLSPAYLSYGLWNLYDPEKGILIHHGIGLDPAEYRLEEARKLPLYGKTRSIGTFLIAVKVR